MKLFFVIACVLAGASANIRDKRNILNELPIGVSSGYGGSYASYGDYRKYGEYPSSLNYPSSYGFRYSSYGSYFETPSVSNKMNMKKAEDIPKLNTRKLKRRKVVKVRKLTPQVTTAAPSDAGGFIGYGSGNSSRNTIFAETSRSSNPGYGFVYASAWW